MNIRLLNYQFHHFMWWSTASRFGACIAYSCECVNSVGVTIHQFWVTDKNRILHASSLVTSYTLKAVDDNIYLELYMYFTDLLCDAMKQI